MRILSVLLFLSLLSACSSNKQTRQSRANAAYDARTEAQRTSRTSTPALQPNPQSGGVTRRSDNAPEPRPATAPPVKTTDAPALGSMPAATPKSAGEWMVTSIKAKFLAIDTTTTRIYMDLTAKTPTGEAVTNPADFISHFLIAYVIYPDYNNRERLGYGNVTLTTQNVGVNGEYLTLQFDVKRPKDAANAVLLTEVTETNSGTKARNDLSLRFRGRN